MSTPDAMPDPGKVRDRLVRRAERLVCDQIGPMGKLLVERSNALAQTWGEFVFLITAHLPPEQQQPVRQGLREIWERQ